MEKTIVYVGSNPFKYYLVDIFFENEYEVDEDEFFGVVGTDRDIVPMRYDINNINRQNFFLNDRLIGYRIR